MFYPDSLLDAIYRHPCPAEPQGYETRTPYGTVDILPVEADPAVMAQYPALAFLGWNTADAGQLERLTEYVRQGGTLVLGWPHLFTDVRRADVFSGTPHPLDAHELTGVKLLEFIPGSGPTVGRVTLGANAKVLQKHDGLPLVVCNRLGEGRVFFVNAREYPAETTIRPVYEALLRMLGEREREREKKNGFLESAGTVESCVYDVSDGSRVIYAINTDWYSRNRSQAGATLWMGDRSYPAAIRPDAIHTFTVRGDCAAEVSDPDTEVLSIERKLDGIHLRVQGLPGGVVTLYHDGGVRSVALSQSGITQIVVPVERS